MVTLEALHNIRGHPCIWRPQTCVALMTWEEDPIWVNLEVLWWSSVVRLWRQEVLRCGCTLFVDLTWLSVWTLFFDCDGAFPCQLNRKSCKCFFIYIYISSFLFTAVEVYASTMTSEKTGNVKRVQCWFHSFLNLCFKDSLPDKI